MIYNEYERGVEMGKGNRKKNSEVQVLNTESNVSLITTTMQASLIMDKLESMGIKRADFDDGSHFSKKGDLRGLASDSIMLMETENEFFIGIKKPGSDDEINTEGFPKITQKMLASYSNVSQSKVSKEKKRKKKPVK